MKDDSSPNKLNGLISLATAQKVQTMQSSAWGNKIMRSSSSSWGERKRPSNWGTTTRPQKKTSCGWGECSFKKVSASNMTNILKPSSCFKTNLGFGEFNDKIYIEREHGKNVYFMRYRWGKRIKILEIPLSNKAHFDKECVIDGQYCSLIVVKVERQKKGKNYFNSDFVRGYYLSFPSNGIYDDYNVKSELEKLGDFSKISANKAVSRLELMITPACRHHKQGHPYHFPFKTSSFKLIVENGNMGCGFVSEKIMHECFGGAAAVQVRIIGPKIGWFKGMLMMKLDIDGFELPPSMQKVEPTRLECSEDWVYVLANRVFPTNTCKNIAKKLHPDRKNPPLSLLTSRKTFSKHLDLNTFGIDRDILSEYSSQSESWERHNHAFCVGVADPTDSLPTGHIFLTGFPCESTKIFITRFPNTEKKDGRVVPIVRKKPKKMSKKNWDMLLALEFGIVIFSNDLMPATIADGDLDGDLYFICWDNVILSSILKDIRDTTKSERKSSYTDDLIGTEFVEKIGGKSQIVVVEDRLSKDQYRVRVGNNYLSMMKDDLEKKMKGKYPVKGITGHRAEDKKTNVEIEYCNGSKEWKLLDSKVRKECEFWLVEYAIEKCLLEDPAWRWITEKDLTKEARIEKIVSHRKKEGNLEAEMLFDDGMKVWDTVKNIKKDPEDLQLLREYAMRNNLLKTKGWMQLGEVQNGKDWFDDVQEILSDAKQLYMFDRLTISLHSAYKKYKKLHGVEDRTSRALGKGFKDSIDIRKHGGHVELPLHLRHHISNKALHNYLKLRVDSDEDD